MATVLYHLTASPGATFSPHNAAHVGTGLASGHTAAARDFEVIRQRARGREDLVDELAGAAAAGLRRAQALLAAAIAPRDAVLAELAAADPAPDPDQVRGALLASMGGRTQWSPDAGQPDGRPVSDAALTTVQNAARLLKAFLSRDELLGPSELGRGGSAWARAPCTGCWSR